MDKNRYEKIKYQRMLNESHGSEGGTYQYKTTEKKLSKSSDGVALDEEQEERPSDVIEPRWSTRTKNAAKENPGIMIISSILAVFLSIVVPVLISQSGKLGEVGGALGVLKTQIQVLQNKYDDKTNDGSVNQFKQDLQRLEIRVDFIEKKI